MCVCICDTGLWGPQVCPLLKWPVCYFYWSHKLLTMSVMTVQVVLILSSLFTNCIGSWLISVLGFVQAYSTVVCFSSRISFTTALESVELAKKYNQAELAMTSQQSVYAQLFMITEYQSKCIFTSKPSEQKWDQNRISCGNKTKHYPQTTKTCSCLQENPRRNTVLMVETLFLQLILNCSHNLYFSLPLTKSCSCMCESVFFSCVLV